MKISKLLKNLGVCSIVFAVTMGGIQAPVMADLVDSQALAIQADLQLQRDEVRSLMARADVRDALLDYGVSAADLDTRIDNLTESELLQIQNQLAELPAGGEVVALVLGVILIFVLLDLLGATDVFSGI